jgi:hypothetical protein
MKIIYHEYDQLPKLAWCAVVEENSPHIHVYHGKNVETFENFFVEGAWNGDFASAGFDKSYFFMGSGMRLENHEGNEKMIFSTPNHTFERLHSISNQKTRFISNSLPFILSMTQGDLDIEYLDYERDFNTILKGIKEYKRQIPLKDGKSVRLHYYCNIILDSKGELQEESKISTGAFRDYSHYHDTLLSTLRAFVENAQDAQRKINYGMASTISKGYDSPAAAAMAHEVGCNTVVSFDRPLKFANDCGEDIALKLGYKNIIKKDADEYLSNTKLVEAEFLSSGELGTDIIYASFEKEFSDNIAFTGEHGGGMWGKSYLDINKEMRYETIAFTETSLIEYRLRVGFISVPIPIFGAEERPSIIKISNLSEMMDYSIGGEYDRPIPRRILESRGVDREMFGMEKHGAGFSYRFDSLGRIKKRMAAKSFEAFHSYYKNNRRKGIKVAKRWMEYLWEIMPRYLQYGLKKIGIRIRVRDLKYDAIPSPGAPSYLINWGVHEMIERYQGALSK